MNDWADIVAALQAAPAPQVLVTVLATRGSTPRGPGTRMLVGRDCTAATIGGGHLEFQSIALARTWLDHPDGRCRRIERFPLGARLGQCCGGVVQLCFERVSASTPWVAGLCALAARGESGVLVLGVRDAPSLLIAAGACYGALPAGSEGRQLLASARRLLGDRQMPAVDRRFGHLVERIDTAPWQVLLFGAGHVGRAVVRVLSSLPVRIDWVDSRENAFPEPLPRGVHPQVDDTPEDAIDEAPLGSYVLIMTHSHALDLRLCHRALGRPDFAYVGLIGSRAKRRRFERQLRDRGLGESTLARLICPIGIGGIRGKHPAEIAVGVVAELLQTRERLARCASPERSLMAERCT